MALAEVDLRPGGAYRIHMRAPDGNEHRAYGVYREVDPPRRLVYTFGWEGEHTVKDSVVTVDFHQRAEGTEVVVSHALIMTEAERDNHALGWTGILEKLESAFSHTS